jgi:iron complex outermembrane recepter protein
MGTRISRLFATGTALTTLLVSQAALAQAQQSADSEQSGTEIIVTATRKNEVLSKVPISVSAFSADTLDKRGVRDFADIIRQTPGVVFEQTNTTTNIAIRGINSTVGASTTGLYIDDTPIQVRALGYSGGNVYPLIFDLDRIEVLRGPQGTLFGSGSQGGTIRFITPQPDTTKTSIRVRSEIATTESGGPSYELGGAIGVPLVQDKLAIRASAYYRRDGGWIDRVRFEDRSVIDKNANRNDSFAGRVALAWTPTPELTITPSLVYQRIKANDSPESWDNIQRDLTSPNAPFSDYENGVFLNGNRVRENSNDRFVLPSLNVKYDLGDAELIAIGSYFDRRQTFQSDYTTFDQSLFTGVTLPIFPDQFAVSDFINTQKNLTGELRLQSTAKDSAFSWVVGAFYQQAKQVSIQQVEDRLFYQYAPFLIPFLPPLVDNRLIYDQATSSKDTQYAAFGQASWKPVDRLTLTLGLRYGETKFAINSFAQGPVVGPPVTDVGTQKESPFTPKFGVDFQIDPQTLVYASVAKGFRPGGYNPQVGVPCAAELAAIGYPNGRPELYGSDTVWSYELGVKSRLAGGRLGISGSVYQIDWNDIQQAVGVNSCGFQFTANLGRARSRGVDIQFDAKITDRLTFQAEIGYNDAEFRDTFLGGPTATLPLVTAGNKVASPPWTISLHGQYDIPVGANMAYVRSDFDYRAQQKDLTPFIDPRNGGVDPTLTNPPEVKAWSARAGYRFHGVDVSVFVNNILDQSIWQGRRSRDNGLSTIYRSHIVRPRTFGLTAAYSY